MLTSALATNKASLNLPTNASACDNHQDGVLSPVSPESSDISQAKLRYHPTSGEVKRTTEMLSLGIIIANAVAEHANEDDLSRASGSKTRGPGRD